MSQPRNAAGRRGFTLMELLVVVAIISVLIAFLLPALSEARRSSNKVKCLAALRDLSNSFNMYAVEFQQAWPVVLHDEGSDKKLMAVPTPGNGSFGERHWTDLIAKYAGSPKIAANMANYKDIEKFKTAKSVIWGCPEWESRGFWDGNTTYPDAGKYCTGYGMSWVANAGDYMNGAGAIKQDSMAWISLRSTGPKVYGGYQKTSIWGKKSSDKLLLADSQVYWTGYAGIDKLPPLGTGIPGNLDFQGYPGAALPANLLPLTYSVILTSKVFMIDAGRHLKPGVAKDKMYKMNGINALFADGHASTITVPEAWYAIYYPGLRP
jgi:prepilin-type N-terminal cleavage/methylation domain-containing protein/prepilin-type processing-associated H-X9-DG protein